MLSKIDPSYLYGYQINKNRPRTKAAYPYSYDPITIMDRSEFVKPNASVYSDRLFRNDMDKYNSLRMKHFGDIAQCTWSDSPPNLIEAFLRDYFGNPKIQIVKIIECCDQMSGFPVWYFSYYAPQVG